MAPPASHATQSKRALSPRSGYRAPAAAEGTSAVDETATRRRPGRLHSLLQTPSNQSPFFFVFLFLARYARVSVIERTPVQPYQRSQLRQATQPGEPARPADHRQASSLEGTQTTRPTSLAGFFFSLPLPSLPPKRRCSRQQPRRAGASEPTS